MVCLPISSVRRGIAFRLALCGIALTSLPGCATTGEKTAAQATKAPVTQVAALPAETTATKSTARSPGYSDPAVVVMAAGDQQQTPPPAATLESAADSGLATATLGDVVMQPAAINAGQTSIFAQQQAPVPAEASAATMTSASIVPADMPTRRVSPMTGSLFSAPQYASAEPVGLPVDEQPAALLPEEEPPADSAEAAAAPVTEEEASADAATPVAEEAPAKPAKKTLFPILDRLLGKARS